MAAINHVRNGGSVVWITPVTLTNGNLTVTMGTPVISQLAANGRFSFNVGSESTQAEFTDVALGSGVTMQVPKRTTVVDETGANKAGGATGSVDSISIDIYENDLATLTKIRAFADNPVVVCLPRGDADTAGYVYLLGRLGGAVEVNTGSGAAIPLSFQGKAYSLNGGVTASAFAAALMATFASTAQYGLGVNLNPSAGGGTALVAGDIANPGLLAGTLVLKAYV